MLFVNYKIHAPIEEVRSVLIDNNLVVDKEKFDTSAGTPKMRFKEKGDRLKITCEMTGKATRDNGFLVGTYFSGKLTEKNGVTALRGIILTAPIYHLILILLLAFFVYRCIVVGGFSVLPICLAVFDIFMFWGEFKKQCIIKRYIFRAFKITYANLRERE